MITFIARYEIQQLSRLYVICPMSIDTKNRDGNKAMMENVKMKIVATCTPTPVLVSQVSGVTNDVRIIAYRTRPATPRHTASLAGGTLTSSISECTGMDRCHSVASGIQSAPLWSIVVWMSANYTSPPVAVAIGSCSKRMHYIQGSACHVPRTTKTDPYPANTPVCGCTSNAESPPGNKSHVS